MRQTASYLPPPSIVELPFRKRGPSINCLSHAPRVHSSRQQRTHRTAGFFHRSQLQRSGYLDNPPTYIQLIGDIYLPAPLPHHSNVLLNTVQRPGRGRGPRAASKKNRNQGQNKSAA